MVEPRDTQDRWAHRSGVDRPQGAAALRRTGFAAGAAVPRTAPYPRAVR
ncbi:hypothetical protein [Streptomyces sp. NPDC018711]